MVKVTFCIYDKPDSVGGPVTWVQRLLPALQRKGVDVRCLFLLHWGDTGSALESLRASGIDCRVTIASERTIDNVRWILKQLRENPPDVFVPNLVVAAYHAGRWAREAGIPTVGILHSDDAYYRALQDEFVSGAPPSRLSGAVCVSKELERQLIDRQAEDVIVRRIPYGVPLPPAIAKRQTGLGIVFAGRLVEEQKRISDVTRAFVRAVRQVPGIEAVIYGDGPDKPAVENILAAEPADVAVRLGGVLSSDQLQQRFLDADVIVLLSDYEGLPISLMEAMACGCIPVCLRMRSGISELVENGVTGLIVEDRGADFVRAVRRLADDPSLRNRLSTAARERIAREFSEEACALAWTSFLRDVAAPAHPRRRIRVPESIRLPRRNPDLESAAQRAQGPSLPLRAFRRGRMVGGRLKQILLRRPTP